MKLSTDIRIIGWFIVVLLVVIGVFLFFSGEQTSLVCNWTKSSERVDCTINRNYLFRNEQQSIVLHAMEIRKRYYTVANGEGGEYLKYDLIPVLLTEDGETQLVSKAIAPKSLVSQVNAYLENPSRDELRLETRDTRYVNYLVGTALMLGGVIKTVHNLKKR